MTNIRNSTESAPRVAGGGPDRFPLVIGGVSLVMSVAAILLTPAAHRVTVGGLALAAFAISLGLDLWQARRTAGASPDTATAQPAMGLRPATPLATPPGVALASVPANPVAGWAPAALRVSAFSCPKEGMKAGLRRSATVPRVPSSRGSGQLP
jgi:hypothetical protein